MDSPSPNKGQAPYWAPALAALGVVYGDIGTSPLYALKECFSGEYGVPPNFENVVGVLSLVFWAITWIVLFKYLIVLMRASNQGEGGIMALIALLTPQTAPGGLTRRVKLTVIFLGLFGAALLYGDGVITPAVSVLSAVEGVEIFEPSLHRVIVPLTIAILIALFVAQRKGTARIGAIFGPIMFLWFATIAVIAVPWIARTPQVLHALNPLSAARFLFHSGWHAVMVLTAVVLCVTGAEALYADMGHFGAPPIRRAWFCLVFPALTLNYFGQGALLLEKGPAALDNPFYSLAPSYLLIPLVLLATVATVIASQALISGIFSMTQQATLLNFMPSFRVIHTSSEEEGQIYIPKINLILCIACIALVLAFQSSARLTGAYGIAVTGTMTITSLLFYRVSRDRWNWSVWRAASLTLLFLIVDGSLLLPNFVKILHGGWVPIVIAILIFTLMTTWHRGQEILWRVIFRKELPLEDFAKRVLTEHPQRVPGTGIYLLPHERQVPGLLFQQYRTTRVLRERVILLSLSVARIPYAPEERHARLSDLGDGIYLIACEFGFMEQPRMEDILGICQRAQPTFDCKDATFYVGREHILSGGTSKMANWRKDLFAFIRQNSERPADVLSIHPDSVVEIGTAVRI